jgi:hypothetical protein
MNKFPDKEEIINLTDEEIDNLKILIDKTVLVDLKKLCKKYVLKCSSLKVKELRDFLKVFLKKQHEGKFEYTYENLKKKLLKDLKKIIQDNKIKTVPGDKKEEFIKKIIKHFKSSKSRSKSKSPSPWGIKFKSPKTKEKISIKHKFKKEDKVFIPEMGEYGKVINYDYENKIYTVLTNDDVELELSEDKLKQISPKKVSHDNDEYSLVALRKKLLKDIKQIMKDNKIKVAKGDKKEDCIKKIVAHFKKSKSKSPVHVSPQKKHSPVYVPAPGGVEESKDTYPPIHTEYSAETVKYPSKVYSAETELPEIDHEEPEYIDEEEPVIHEEEYHQKQPFTEQEIFEDTERIDMKDIEGVLSELQSISIDNILDNNVRIKKTIQKCLAIGVM